jgi:hypothetical protein
MDDLLIAIIIAGVGLSVTYLRAELVLRQELKAAERKKERALRELHITRPRREHTALLRQPGAVSWPVQTNPACEGFGPRIPHSHTRALLVCFGFVGERAWTGGSGLWVVSFLRAYQGQKSLQQRRSKPATRHKNPRRSPC